MRWTSKFFSRAVLAAVLLGLVQGTGQCVPETFDIRVAVDDTTGDGIEFLPWVIGPTTEDGVPSDCDVVFNEVKRSFMYGSPCGDATLATACCDPAVGCLDHLEEDYSTVPGSSAPDTIAVRARGTPPRGCVVVTTLGLLREMVSFGCKCVDPLEEGILVELRLDPIVPDLLEIEPTAGRPGDVVSIRVSTGHDFVGLYIGGQPAPEPASLYTVPDLPPGDYDAWVEGNGGLSNTLPFTVLPPL